VATRTSAGGVGTTAGGARGWTTAAATGRAAGGGGGGGQDCSEATRLGAEGGTLGVDRDCSRGGLDCSSHDCNRVGRNLGTVTRSCRRDWGAAAGNAGAMVGVLGTTAAGSWGHSGYGGAPCRSYNRGQQEPQQWQLGPQHGQLGLWLGRWELQHGPQQGQS
jgi:hypothetical protein